MFEKRKLKKALEQNDVASVRALLKNNKELLWTEINHRIPFYHAVRDGQDDMAIMMIDEFGFKPGQPYEGYTNAFFQMVSRGRLDLFKRYQGDYDAVIIQDRQGKRNLLQQAACSGQTDFINHLIGMGFDVFEKNEYGKTACSYAQEYRHPDAVKILKRAEEAKKALSRAPKQKAVTDGWQKLDDQRIALIREEKEIGLRYTDLFNFAAGDITRTVHNLSTKVESSAITRITADSADCCEAAKRLGISLLAKTLPIAAKTAISS